MHRKRPSNGHRRRGRDTAGHHYRVVSYKPHKVITVTCSPRSQKRSRNGIGLSCVFRMRCRETAQGDNRAIEVIPYLILLRSLSHLPQPYVGAEFGIPLSGSSGWCAWPCRAVWRAAACAQTIVAAAQVYRQQRRLRLYNDCCPCKPVAAVRRERW